MAGAPVCGPGDENVRRLNIAMEDSLRVRRMECVSHFNGQVQQYIGIDGFPGYAVLQRHTVQKFHRDEGPIPALSDLVDGADVGMIEGGSRAGLTPEAFQSLRIRRHIVGQEFQGDKAAQVNILRLIDDAHTAAAELFNDAVVRYDLADREDGTLENHPSYRAPDLAVTL